MSTLQKTVARGVHAYSDYQKQHNFFEVDRVWPLVTEQSVRKEKMKPENREKAWHQLCESAHLPLESSYWAENEIQGDFFVMRFSNGLELVDNDSRILFNAGDKKKVDMDSALSVVRCAANHLYRETGEKPNISTRREGSTDMVNVFEKSCKETQKMLNLEMIEKLRARKPQ